MGEKLQDTAFEHANTLVPLRNVVASHKSKPKHIGRKWQTNRKQPLRHGNAQSASRKRCSNRQRPRGSGISVDRIGNATALPPLLTLSHRLFAAVSQQADRAETTMNLPVGISTLPCADRWIGAPTPLHCSTLRSFFRLRRVLRKQRRSGRGSPAAQSASARNNQSWVCRNDLFMQAIPVGQVLERVRRIYELRRHLC